MDFPSSNDQPSKTGHKHQQVSSSELFSSAKQVADAAKSSLSHQKVDQGQAAGAAANLLGGASQYGKLEEKSYGKYVEKAEDYLRQQSSHSTAATTTAGHQSGSDTPITQSTPTQSSGEDGKSSGVGDYFKMAQGFMK